MSDSIRCHALIVSVSLDEEHKINSVVEGELYLYEENIYKGNTQYVQISINNISKTYVMLC